MKNFLLVLLLCPLIATSAEVELLLKSGRSWNGGVFEYPDGNPEISILRITLQEGQETPFHCHPVPTFGYLLKGTLEVRTGTGERTLFKEGDAAIEVMDTVHRGKAIEGPVEILVFYTGAEKLSNSIPRGQADCS